MATVSFHKKIVIKDEKAIDILIKCLSKNNDNRFNNMDVEKELERGSILLKKLSSY